MSSHHELTVIETDAGFVINRAAVMAMAWLLHRHDLKASAQDGLTPLGFGAHLKDAWRKAKAEVSALEYVRASRSWTPEERAAIANEMVDRGWRRAA